MENYTQTPHSEEIDKIILEWYKGMDKETLEYWTAYAAQVIKALKDKGGRHFGLHSAMILVARYKLGMIEPKESLVWRTIAQAQAARERVSK